jgi:hypothetical protein
LVFEVISFIRDGAGTVKDDEEFFVLVTEGAVPTPGDGVTDQLGVTLGDGLVPVLGVMLALGVTLGDGLVPVLGVNRLLFCCCKYVVGHTIVCGHDQSVTLCT